MLNQFVLVGRVSNINKTNDKECTVTLEIPRSFKNENGDYENDYVQVSIKGEQAKTAMEYLVQNDLVGVKGRFSNTSDIGTLVLFVERLTFLAQYKEREEKEHE